MREVHDERGAIRHGGVEIAARRMAAEDVMVIPDAAHPRTGGGLARGRRQRPLDVGDGAGAAAVGPERLEGADGEVIVRVDEARDDGASLEIDEKLPLDDVEELVEVVVLVPVILSLNHAEPHD